MIRTTYLGIGPKPQNESVLIAKSPTDIADFQPYACSQVFLEGDDDGEADDEAPKPPKGKGKGKAKAKAKGKAAKRSAVPALTNRSGVEEEDGDMDEDYHPTE